MSQKDIKNKLKEALEANAQRETSESHNRKPFILIACITFLGAVMLFGYVLLFSNTPTRGPWGQIKKPAHGKTTGQKVRVTGETKNIESGQYIWLAVDKSDIGLCWPKMHITESNTNFRTTVMEEGLEEPYSLSLYLVNQTIHEQWKEWLEHEIFGGLHMPPERKRLDSVRLLLEI